MRLLTDGNSGSVFCVAWWKFSQLECFAGLSALLPVVQPQQGPAR